MSDPGPKLPAEVREGVRSGILAAIAQDVELRGGRTARRLVSAGVVGITGAIGAVLIVSTHPFDHHPHWHEMIFGAVWSGILVVSVALVLLQVQTPRLPIARAGTFGLVGLGLAGICSLLCPDAHLMGWWFETAAGSAIAERTSLWTSALCFGFGTVFLIAWAPATLLLRDSGSGLAARRLAALFFAVLLAPGIILGSVGLPLSVFAAWLVGAIAGAYGGVEAGVRFRALFQTW